MQLEFPEIEFINLINALESNTCPIPNSGSDRVSPTEAAGLRMEGIKLKRDGDLVGSNASFIEMFKKQDTICSDGLWSWAKTLLLAKDFRHAQLLMHADFANTYRGEKGCFCPFVWMNIRLNLPGLDIEWLYDDSRPNYKLYALDYFENPEQLVERIYAFGGNDGYWRFNYTWTSDDYYEFINYFGPISTLATEDQAYAWTGDDQDELIEMYNAILDKMDSNTAQQEQEEFRYEPNKEYVNERGMPVLPMPDNEICDLILKLEAGQCDLPNAGNPPVLESDVARHMNQAAWMVKDGDLRGAHNEHLKIFEIQTTLASITLNAWIRILLLAKDFGHAQFILQLAEINIFRGEKWYSFSAQRSLDQFLTPRPKEMTDALQYMRYLQENKIDYNDREALETRIAKLGYNDEYWLPRYKLTEDEHREFLRYFGEYHGSYKVDFEYSRRSY